MYTSMFKSTGLSREALREELRQFAKDTLRLEFQVLLAEMTDVMEMQFQAFRKYSSTRTFNSSAAASVGRSGLFSDELNYASGSMPVQRTASADRRHDSDPHKQRGELSRSTNGLKIKKQLDENQVAWMFRHRSCSDTRRHLGFNVPDTKRVSLQRAASHDTLVTMARITTGSTVNSCSDPSEKKSTREQGTAPLSPARQHRSREQPPSPAAIVSPIASKGSYVALPLHVQSTDNVLPWSIEEEENEHHANAIRPSLISMSDNPREFTGDDACSDAGQMGMRLSRRSRNPSGAPSSEEVGRTNAWRRRATTKEDLSDELFQLPVQRNSVAITPIMKVVMHIQFTYFIGWFIVLNALYMGIETDYLARHSMQDPPRWFHFIDIFFCVLFSLEIILRIFTYGHHFFQAAGWQWNLFDLFVVMLQVLETIAGVVSRNPGRASGSSSAGVLRMMRVIRLLRVLRLVRLMSVFSELRMFIVSIGDSMRSLFWTVVFILLVMYVGGICLTQLVTDYKKKLQSSRNRIQHDEVRELDRYWGTLDKSMLTLFETISEGIHWSEVVKPLMNYSPWMAVLFAAWMAFALYAMLNVVTGVFVEQALHTCNEDKKKLLMYEMSAWFSEADTDETGTISWEEFENNLHHPKMETFLKQVDLDTQEAADLFDLLDIQETGEIAIDEFVNGCVRVTGTAKAIDLVTLMHYLKKTFTVIFESNRENAELVESIKETLDAITNPESGTPTRQAS